MGSLTWSVVIPMYNGMPYIDETLASVWDAGCRREDTIVVDDMSSDGSADHVRNRYPGIQFIQHPSNTKGLRSRQTGLTRVLTDAVLLLDHDDLLVSPGITTLLRALKEHPDAVAAVGDFERFAEDADAGRHRWQDMDRYWPRRTRIWSSAPLDLHVRIQYLGCWLTRTKVALTVMQHPTFGPLMSSLANQDWAYLSVLACQGPVVACPDVSLLYRVRLASQDRLMRPPRTDHVLAEFYRELRALQVSTCGSQSTRAFWTYQGHLAVGDDNHQRGRYTAAVGAYLRALLASSRVPSGHTWNAAAIGLLSSLRRIGQRLATRFRRA